MNLSKPGTLACASVLALLAGTASAEVTRGTGLAEVYAGWYFPDESPSGPGLDDFTYGVRFGYNFADRWGFAATIGRFETNVNELDLELEQVFVDLGVEWNINADGRYVWVMSMGPGWSFAEATTDGVSIDADSLSLHLGIGMKMRMTDRFYVRPEVRLRWYEEDPEDDIEFEITVALGWVLGSH